MSMGAKYNRCPDYGDSALHSEHQSKLVHCHRNSNTVALIGGRNDID